MRVIPYRDVLWGVAFKLGLDPDQSNFLTNQAVPLGTYINEWVRRSYDSKDWPEWVVTHKFAPVSHLVAWDATAIDLHVGSSTVGTVVQIGRVLKVFLVDPATTSCPIDTPFTLRDGGIHVGYEHGQYVWIRYMAPAPQFTAVSWRADTTFQKDDVTYSYRSGEVYRSKANNNLGHDPATSFSAPPVPIIVPPTVPPPATEIIQPLTTDNLGVAGRSQIVVIYFTDATPPPADPPVAGNVFNVYVYDYATLTTIASATHIATGAESLATIIGALRTTLVADPDLSTYTITVDATAKTMTLVNASTFSCAQSAYGPGSSTVVHLLKSVVTQSYATDVPATGGAAQITRITMSDETTYPGATYSLVITDSDSVAHTVEYESLLSDGTEQILNGLSLAMDAASDTYFEGVESALFAAGSTLDVATRDNTSVGVNVATTGSAWWELVPFPKALADTVMRGAYADLLKEWGQTDKGMAEEGQVPNEDGIATSKFATMPDPPLTGQERGLSRYRLES